jgi:hypothetical protein
MNKYPKTMINPNIVIDIFNTMKREPNKTFAKRDFEHSRLVLEHSFHFLERLELVEEVPYFYYSDEKRYLRRQIKGYRLVRNGN